MHIGHDVTNRVPACDNFQFLNQIKILSRFFNQDLAKWGMNRNKKLAVKIKQRSCVDMLVKAANSEIIFSFILDSHFRSAFTHMLNMSN